MSVLRNAALGVVAAVAVVTLVGCGLFQDTPACGCSPAPDPEPAAERAAVHFEDLLRRGDVSGAWARLTDAAQARYANVDGFRPVADRLGAAYRDAGAAGRTGDWPAVHTRIDLSSANEVAVARYAGSPPRFVSALVVQVWLGRTGAERIDPEPAALELRVSAEQPFALRVEVPSGGPEPASFVVIGAGGPTVPGERSLAPGAYRLLWTDGEPTGQILVIVAVRTDAGWRIGAATATMPDD